MIFSTPYFQLDIAARTALLSHRQRDRARAVDLLLGNDKVRRELRAVDHSDIERWLVVTGRPVDSPESNVATMLLAACADIVQQCAARTLPKLPKPPKKAAIRLVFSRVR